MRALPIVLVGLMAACGEGSSGPTDGEAQTDHEEITETVEMTGGRVEHPEGFLVDFEEDTFAAATPITVSEVELPEALPNEIEPASKVFRIECSNDLLKPARIRFELDATALEKEDGELGIYRWDGESWTGLGGEVTDDDGLESFTNAFSDFIIGTGRSLHKKLRFNNAGPHHATVVVSQYVLAHPDLDSPIATQYGIPVFAPPFDAPFGCFGYFPQGAYQFCAEWWDDDSTPAELWHKFEGNEPGNWSYVLDLNTSLTTPPEVNFDTSIAGAIEGPCPPTESSTPTNPPGLAIVGSWLGLSGSPFTSMTLTNTTFVALAEDMTLEADIIEYDNDQMTLIIQWDEDDYEKLVWQDESGGNISIQFYDSVTTLAAARDDDEPGEDTWYSFAPAD